MTARPGIHWQLLWFSQIALAHGVFYGAAYLNNVKLTSGVGALPHWVLVVAVWGWVLAALFGHLSALVVRRFHSRARHGIGIMLGAWSGAYAYGFLFGGSSSGWLLAWVYAVLGLAVVTPPVWLVTLKAKTGL